jgi:hypothetical protein
MKDCFFLRVADRTDYRANLPDISARVSEEFEIEQSPHRELG